jgi:uncharacterized protein with von Willebrand factor type A (vWA) domain
MRSLNPKVKNLLDRIRHGEKLSIDYDNFDLEKFRDIKDRSKALMETDELGSKDYEQFPELMQDTFDALYKNDPTSMDEWKMKPNFLLNREITKKLMESARYNELRVMTQLDELTSALGTEIMSEQLIEWIKELKEQREAQQALSDAVSDLMASQGEETDEGGPDEKKKGKGTKAYTLEQAMKLYEEAKAKFDGSVQEKKFVQGIERVAAKVKDQVKETSEMISNWGLGRSESYTRRPVNEKMELLNKLRTSPKLQQIAKLAGRYRRLAMQTRREKIKKGIDDVYSIKPGSDLSRLIPSELMRLKHPVTRKTFMADFIEGKTLNYEIRGKDKKAKGPIIICIDESGSMNGLPEIWSKSVALALLEIAREQKRDFFVIHFSSQTSADQLHTNEFLKDQPFEVEQMIDMAEYFENGGTTFEPPLDLARKKIGDSRLWSKADIIFVTDGESAVAQKWYEDYNVWKKENKVSVYSILIDSGPNTPVVLRLFSDKVEKLSNLKTGADNIAINIFADI